MLDPEEVVTIRYKIGNLEKELNSLGFDIEKRNNDVYHIKPSYPPPDYPTNKIKDRYRNYTFSELFNKNPLTAHLYVLNVALLRTINDEIGAGYCIYRLVKLNREKSGLADYHELLHETFFD